MLELKVRKIGNSLGVVLPKEAVKRLRAENGDRLYLIEGPNGAYQLTPYDPAYQQWLATARAGLTTRVGAVAADPKSLGLLYNVLGQQARLLAFMDIFRVTSTLALVAVPLVLLFKKTPTRRTPSAH